jgi:hypothetical protein
MLHYLPKMSWLEKPGEVRASHHSWRMLCLLLWLVATSGTVAPHRMHMQQLCSAVSAVAVYAHPPRDQLASLCSLCESREVSQAPVPEPVFEIGTMFCALSYLKQQSSHGKFPPSSKSTLNDGTVPILLSLSEETAQGNAAHRQSQRHSLTGQ